MLDVGLIVDNNDLGTATWSSAIQMCEQLTKADYTDWYLPSLAELSVIAQYENQIGGFETARYWSNTEYSNSEAWCQQINIAPNQQHWPKDYYSRVRCVRKR